MERRVLLAVFLAFLVIYVWQALFVKPQPRQQPGAPPAAQTASTPVAQPAANIPSGLVPTAAAPPSDSVLGEATEREIAVETPNIRATLTNRGGRLKSYRLKRYLDYQGQPVELTVPELAASQPLPFSLRVDDEATTATLNAALFTVRQAESATHAPEVTFEYRDRAGLRVVKTFRFDPASYIVEFTATVATGDRALQPVIEWGPGLGDPDTTTGRYAVKPGGLTESAGSVQRLAAAAIAKQSAYDEIGRAHV